MKNRWSLKGQNRGASLIAVLVAIIFVTTIAAIVVDVTITNIQMKEVEQAGKKNFYSAEEVMDELTSGLNDIASRAMQEAYTEILTDYRNIMIYGEDVQSKFTRIYIGKLQGIFWNGVPETYSATKRTTDPLDNTNIVYAMGYYLPDHIENCLTAPNRVYFKTVQADAAFTADFVEGLFTLKNVKVDFTDAQGYETTICTDVVFHTPVLNFEGSNIIRDFMKYSLIADQQISVDTNVKMDGNVYAGAGGINFSTPATAVMTGNNIVTRGDISVGSGTSVEIGTGITTNAGGQREITGSSTTRIWAENIQTTGKGAASSLILNGNSYVSDDLMLNGANSTVVLGGNYYGYNFQEKYDALQTVKDSAYSSAMMLNARNSRLDLTGLDYLLLAGRTYISRGSKGNTQNMDVMLGESVSVRTNQLAYDVSERFLDTTDKDNVQFTATGAADYSSYIGVPDITVYLDPVHPITTYYYRDDSRSSQRYYLKFANEQRANDFFAAFYAANKGKVDAYAESYTGNNAIIIDDTTLYTLKGDIMYQNAKDAERQEKLITISPGDWTPGAGGTADGIYWNFADRLAITYKSLQTYLEDSHIGITSGDVRFMNGSTVDKKVDPLFTNLIDVDKLKDDYRQTGPDVPMLEKSDPITPGDASKCQLIAVVNNAGMDTYKIHTKNVQGVVIATGDVLVQGNFTGMIISGGTISFTSGANVKADEILVSRLFKEDIDKIENPGESALFAFYFKDYHTLSESVIGIVQIDEYLTYENWKKNGN